MRHYVFEHWRIALSASVVLLAVLAFVLVTATSATAGDDPCCRFTANCEGGYWGHVCLLKNLGCNTGFDDYLCSEIPDP